MKKNRYKKSGGSGGKMYNFFCVGGVNIKKVIDFASTASTFFISKKVIL